ncbi:39S ribosomal protein L16, mitochondrial [Plectropomus leopardus]|uniref:39S ribosomal protein L16, mitochondrial n=1 Tax=Plectropomus leopardus TaxID=160734 RepID=UPI001C4CF96F|nr:39S ribosomal protein L16, mitochondrial [Plectropomus leopardus]
MFSLMKAAVGGLTGICRVSGHQQGLLHSHLKILTAGLKSYDIPPDFSDMVLPEKTKLKFLDKVPNVVKARKSMKRLWDIQGQEWKENSFTTGRYAIMAMGGGYLHWGHMEMMRLSINRKIDSQTTYAIWRIKAPHKSVTRKGLGQRMGGGKGAIDHYVTPVRYGHFIVELGGKMELGEVEHILNTVAKKLPFPAKVVSKESLAAMKKQLAEKRQNNQNPWTFREVVRGNMLGIRKVLSPLDLHNHGRFTGRFHNPWRV